MTRLTLDSRLSLGFTPTKKAVVKKMNELIYKRVGMADICAYQGRVYTPEEVYSFAEVSLISICLEMIIGQNDQMILAAQKVLEAVACGAARQKVQMALCDLLYPSSDLNGNCSYAALEQLKYEMLRVSRPGCIATRNDLAGKMKVVIDSTATLFDRLEKIHNSPALKDAKRAIFHIYDLLIRPKWYGMNEATFCADVGATFQAFFIACQNNVISLSNMFGIERKEIASRLKNIETTVTDTQKICLGEKVDLGAYDARRMGAAKRHWRDEGVEMVRAGLAANPTAAARAVIQAHEKDRLQAYLNSQEKTFARAISRKLIAQGIHA